MISLFVAVPAWVCMQAVAIMYAYDTSGLRCAQFYAHLQWVVDGRGGDRWDVGALSNDRAEANLQMRRHL